MTDTKKAGWWVSAVRDQRRADTRKRAGSGTPQSLMRAGVRAAESPTLPAAAGPSSGPWGPSREGARGLAAS